MHYMNENFKANPKKGLLKGAKILSGKFIHSVKAPTEDCTKYKSCFVVDQHRDSLT